MSLTRMPIRSKRGRGGVPARTRSVRPSGRTRVRRSRKPASVAPLATVTLAPTPAPLSGPPQGRVSPATPPQAVLTFAAPPAEAPPRFEAYAETKSPLTLYMREVGEVALLTPQEEIELAALIKRGDEAARERMIRANLRLVVKIARDYEGMGLPLLDLINEGNIGLMKAVERFDPAKGGKLSTYSSWWIKQSIRRALTNQSKVIRLPVHVADKLHHLRRAEMKLQEVLGREPTDEELAAELGVKPNRVAKLRRAALKPASLDSPLGDDDKRHLADIVADENADTPYEHLENKTDLDWLRRVIKTLDEREESILRQRFGLDGGPERTLEEIGAKFGVTRERIRQLQNIALNKLRDLIEEVGAPIALPAAA